MKLSPMKPYIQFVPVCNPAPSSARKPSPVPASWENPCRMRSFQNHPFFCSYSSLHLHSTTPYPRKTQAAYDMDPPEAPLCPPHTNHSPRHPFSTGHKSPACAVRHASIHGVGISEQRIPRRRRLSMKTNGRSRLSVAKFSVNRWLLLGTSGAGSLSWSC